MEPFSNPDSAEQFEYRFQELRAQRARARQLFHCYADDVDDDSDEVEDVYVAYYGED